MFKRITILPRWAVFFIDILISVAALFISYSIRNEFSFDLINKAIFLKNAAILIALSAIVFLLLKTYRSIIRLTTIQDMAKIFVAVVLINAGFIVVYLLASLFFHKSFISITTLVINGFVGFMLLMFYRLAIRYLYHRYQARQREEQRVIIYGANEEGVTTSNILKEDRRVRYHVFAYLDDDEAKKGKSLDGIRIYHPHQLADLLEAEKIDKLVIASSTVSVDRKNGIVDTCLDHGVEVLLTPPVKEWINGQLSMRQIHGIRIEELLEREPIHIHNEQIAEQMKGRKILVTGAAGSIGSEIVRQLAGYSPHSIVLVDMGETALYGSELELREHENSAIFHYYIADVRNHARMESIFKEHRPHYVYHAAAYKHVPLMEMHPSEAIATNVIGTKNMADLSVKYGVQKFVMISSDKSVNPTNVMGASKRIAEIYVQSLYNHLKENARNDATEPTRFITTRFGNVLGSNGSVIPLFRAQIAQGGPITVTHPDISRYFMTIPEACQLVLEAGSMGKGGEIFVFDMGKLVRIIDLATKMIRLAGMRPGVDIEIRYTGLRPGEKLHEELLTSDENTIPTYHRQILIARVREYDYAYAKAHIEELLRLVEQAKTESEIVRKMKAMIPEYVSNNSVYETLDTNGRQPPLRGVGIDTNA